MKTIISFLFTLILLYAKYCPAQDVRGVKIISQANNDTITGNTYAIIVGISDYPYIKPLQFADKDAELFRDFLQSPAGGNVRAENMCVLLNEQAKSANICVQSFAWLRKKNPQKGDRVYFYLAGHGDAIDKNENFFLAYDCSPAGDKNNYLVSGTIQMFNLKNRIADLSNKGVEVLLIMDACRSNELPGGMEGQKILSDAMAKRRSGETMMLAASSGQESLEDRSIGNGHGLFTWHLIDGLSGKADTDMENGNQNGKVEFDEIESWVRKYVKKSAQQKFNHVQVPFFYSAEATKPIAKVDSAYLQQWLAATKLNADLSQNLFVINKAATSRSISETNADSNVIKLYNQFNYSIKQNKIDGETGELSAEYWYNKMVAQFPQHSYTEDAKYALATELINFSQEKINIYLTANDYIYKNENDTSNKNFLFAKRLRVVANKPFYKVANMLEKGIALSKDFDTTIEKQYLAKLYFLKARGAFPEDEGILTPRIERDNNLEQALEYAYAAQKIDSNAAYINHLLAKFQYCKNWNIYWNVFGSTTFHTENVHAIDSITYYESKAIKLAPNWPYVYYYWGNYYINKEFYSSSGLRFNTNQINPERLDSSFQLLNKCLNLAPNYIPAHVGLAWISNLKNNLSEAITRLKNAMLWDPENVDLKSDMVEYYFKLNSDSGKYYYNLYGGNKDENFNQAFRRLSRYFIDTDNKALSIFICELFQSCPAFTS